MKRLWVLATALLLLLGVFAYAQDTSEPVALLEYFDDPDGIIITASDGTDLFPDFGMQLLPGDKVTTTSSVAELKLDPNGSLVKLGNNTEFVIDSLQGRSGADTNAFSLLTGKLKAVAAHSGNAQYQVRTQTAVCGIRGTILGLDVQPGKTDSVLVTKGLVSFQKLLTGETIDVAAGQIANALADTFQAITATADQVNQFFEGVNDFVGQGMNPDAVPGNEPSAAPETAPSTETPQTDTTSGSTTQPEAAAPAAPSFMQPIMDWLKDYLGMEIGSLTIGDTTYSKAVIQPDIDLGKFKMGLYLPIIYQSNLFDPNDWYHPKGNDEWDFGVPKFQDGEYLLGAEDLLSDILLKIRYMTIGERRDPFYLSVGNLNNMTIGHGVLMLNYANDYDFPAIRRIGVNLGLDLGGFGLEAVVNDLSSPEIFGGRVFFRPFNPFKLAIGASAIIDIDPASALSEADAAGQGNPVFINPGLDLDLPIIGNAVILFADIAAMLPYYREAPTGIPDATAGLYTQAVYNTNITSDNPLDKLQNYGIAAGVMGKVFVLDYRIEFRDYNGTFRPAFYGTNYDRLRGQYVLQLNSELANPTAVDPTLGIFGQAGFSIGDKFTFEAGYMWPWQIDSEGAIQPSSDDQLHLQATVASGLIPKFDIHGSISYDRTRFKDYISDLISGADTTLGLLDAYSVLKGEFIYPIASTLDIAVVVSTAAAYDSSGNAIIDETTKLPEIRPSISIETRVHF